MSEESKYSRGDRAISATLGPGTIRAVEERELAGMSLLFIIFTADSGTQLMIPVSREDEALKPMPPPADG